MFAGCTAFRPYPFTNRGVFLRVLQPMRVATGNTVLQVRNTDMTTPSFEAKLVFAGTLRFIVNNVDIAMQPEVPEWWRIRQPTGTTMVAADLSSDGVTWTTWAMTSASLPPSIAVDIAAGADAPPAPDKAVLASFGICD